jgi:HSP20 family protein
MNRLHREMSRLFDRAGYGDGARRMAPAYPALNLWEDADNLYAEAELPGLSLDDLEIYVTGGNHLSIKGKREVPESDKAAWHRRERGYGQFARALTLPHDVDADKVEAEFRNGVLCIKLPKREESKPRRIEVKPR